jgi:hypothetical protein
LHSLQRLSNTAGSIRIHQQHTDAVHWLSLTVQVQQQFNDSQYWQQTQYAACEQCQMQQCVHNVTRWRVGTKDEKEEDSNDTTAQPASPKVHVVAAQHAQQAAVLSVVTLVERRGAHDA